MSLLHRLQNIRLPGREQIFASRWSKPFAKLFNHNCFWAVNRRKAALSVAVGLFCGLMPGPSQAASALLIAYLLRTNLPIAIFTTFYTNPLTYMPLYYLAYRIGKQIMGLDDSHTLQPPDWDSNFWPGLLDWLGGAGKPLLVGVPVLGMTLALTGYVCVLYGWQYYTRYRKRHRKAHHE